MWLNTPSDRSFGSLRFKLGIVGAALLIGAYSSSPAMGQGEPAVSGMRSDHVLRFHDVRELGGGGSIVDELSIFRDGLTVLRSLGAGGEVRVVRGQAREEQITRLRGILAEERVDLLSGRCNLAGLQTLDPSGAPLAGRQTLLSWFGVEGRRARHLEIGHDTASESGPFDEACSVSLARVAQETLAYTEEVFAGPDVTESPDMNYPSSLLFEIHSDFSSDPDCDPYEFSDTFLMFRDGLLLRSFQGTDGGFRFSRGILNGEGHQRLVQLLVEEGVSQLRGNCRTWFFLPFTIDGACTDYDWRSAATWYGRQGRRSTLAGHEELTRVCSGGQLRIRTQLVVLMLNTISNASSHTVFGRLPI